MSQFTLQFRALMLMTLATTNDGRSWFFSDEKINRRTVYLLSHFIHISPLDTHQCHIVSIPGCMLMSRNPIQSNTSKEPWWSRKLMLLFSLGEDNIYIYIYIYVLCKFDSLRYLLSLFYMNILQIAEALDRYLITGSLYTAVRDAVRQVAIIGGSPQTIVDTMRVSVTIWVCLVIF
jgi:hypothetical protein